MNLFNQSASQSITQSGSSHLSLSFPIHGSPASGFSYRLIILETGATAWWGKFEYIYIYILLWFIMYARVHIAVIFVLACPVILVRVYPSTASKAQTFASVKLQAVLNLLEKTARTVHPRTEPTMHFSKACNAGSLPAGFFCRVNCHR